MGQPVYVRSLFLYLLLIVKKITLRVDYDYSKQLVIAILLHVPTWLFFSIQLHLFFFSGEITRNLETGVLKDSVHVQGDGYTIIRFVADNPGWWLFHCHKIFHIAVSKIHFVPEITIYVLLPFLSVRHRVQKTRISCV